MLKKIVMLAMVVILALACMGCTAKCKYSGCDDEATNGDYCGYHARVQQVDDAAKDIYGFFFGE